MLSDLSAKDSKRKVGSKHSLQQVDMTVLRTSNRTVLRLNLDHVMRALDTVLKIAPQELRAPGGNTDFLMELYEMRVAVAAAIKKEDEANDKKLFEELQDIDADIGRSHAQGT